MNIKTPGVSNIVIFLILMMRQTNPRVVTHNLIINLIKKKNPANSYEIKMDSKMSLMWNICFMITWNKMDGIKLLTKRLLNRVWRSQQTDLYPLFITNPIQKFKYIKAELKMERMVEIISLNIREARNISTHATLSAIKISPWLVFCFRCQFWSHHFGHNWFWGINSRRTFVPTGGI